MCGRTCKRKTEQTFVTSNPDRNSEASNNHPRARNPRSTVGKNGTKDAGQQHVVCPRRRPHAYPVGCNHGARHRGIRMSVCQHSMATPLPMLPLVSSTTICLGCNRLFAQRRPQPIRQPRVAFPLAKILRGNRPKGDGGSAPLFGQSQCRTTFPLCPDFIAAKPSANASGRKPVGNHAAHIQPIL